MDVQECFRLVVLVTSFGRFGVISIQRDLLDLIFANRSLGDFCRVGRPHFALYRPGGADEVISSDAFAYLISNDIDMAPGNYDTAKIG